MNQLVAVAFVAVAVSSPLVEDKMLLPPVLACHTSADRKKIVLLPGSRR